MTPFFLAAAGLSATVILILCIPLLRSRTFGVMRPNHDIEVYRDQLVELEKDRERGLLSEDQTAQAKREIEHRLLAADARARGGSGYHGGRKATAMAIFVAPLIPAAAIGAYYWLGQPGMPDQPFASRAGAASGAVAGAEAQHDIQQMVESLEARLESEPDNVEGWLMLGRSYMNLNRHADARQAYMTAYELTGDVGIRAEAAEVEVFINGSLMTPGTLAVFEALHEADPFDPKSRFYIGLAKTQSGDIYGGVAEWTDLVFISPPEAPWVPIVHRRMAEAAEMGGFDLAAFQPSDEVRELAASLGRGEPVIAQPASPGIPGPSQEDIEAAQEMTADEQMEMIRSMVRRLAERLEANREGWLRLARAYEVLGEDDKAIDAMGRAAAAGN